MRPGLLAAFGFPWSASSNAADVAVKVADHFPPGHVIPHTLLRPWMARVEELTGKKVRFTHFPAQQLVKQTEALSAVQRRVVDIVLVNPGLFPTEFALTGVSFLPNGYDTVVHGGKALQGLFEHPAIKDEFRRAGLRILLIEPLDAYEALTARPVTRPADIRGLKFAPRRPTGGNAWLAQRRPRLRRRDATRNADDRWRAIRIQHRQIV